MTTCVGCKNFHLKEIPAMARHGFGWCPHQNPRLPGGEISRAALVGASRQACEKFDAAEPLAVSERIEWLQRQGITVK